MGTTSLIPGRSVGPVDGQPVGRVTVSCRCRGAHVAQHSARRGARGDLGPVGRYPLVNGTGIGRPAAGPGQRPSRQTGGSPGLPVATARATSLHRSKVAGTLVH